jgi:hypothetical protein
MQTLVSEKVDIATTHGDALFGQVDDGIDKMAPGAAPKRVVGLISPARQLVADDAFLYWTFGQPSASLYRSPR